MAEEAAFADLYKQMMDRNYEPDPQRSRAALGFVLQRLSCSGPPAGSPENGLEQGG